MHTSLTSIPFQSRRLLCIILLCILALSLLQTADVYAQITVITPPTVGDADPGDGKTPIKYLLLLAKNVMLIAFVLMAGVALVYYSGGIISELNEARKRGEWGKFAGFALVGILVILVVMFAGVWGNNFLSNLG